jgi:hypothetical protein
MQARQGRKVAHNVYVTDPGWPTDRLVGQMQSPEAASRVVRALNIVGYAAANDWVPTLPEVPKVD